MKTKKTIPAKAPRKRVARPTGLKRLLCTTDFSKDSLAGVRYATALAGRLKASLELLHVVQWPAGIAGMEGVVLLRDEPRVQAAAANGLKKLAKAESRAGMAITCKVRSGPAYDEICNRARESGADLLVIATHGYTGAKRLLLGGTAERVVRHAPCPVLTVPVALGKRTGKAALSIKRILLPVDFSATSLTALPMAKLLAEHFKAELMLLHVIEKYPIDYMLGPELINETVTPLIKQAETDLQRIAQDVDRSTKVDISAMVRHGRPHEEIAKAAETLEADLVVLSTHGRTGLKHVWLGSTAERVVRHAGCPVLVMRDKK